VTIIFRLSLSSTTLLICDDGSVTVSFFNVCMLEVDTLDGHVGQSVFGVKGLLVVVERLLVVVELIVVLGQR
jgi:hypothetical protein